MTECLKCRLLSLGFFLEQVTWMVGNIGPTLFLAWRAWGVKMASTPSILLLLTGLADSSVSDSQTDNSDTD